MMSALLLSDDEDGFEKLLARSPGAFAPSADHDDCCCWGWEEVGDVEALGARM
jgi:hypothetical protein